MFDFGNLYRDLKVHGLEDHYAAYDTLKQHVNSLKQDPSRREVSETFLEDVRSEVRRVNAFVEKTVLMLRNDFAEAGASGKQLPALDQKVNLMRRFVGTNIIAVANIVQEHDQLVSEDMYKRAEVCNCFNDCQGIKTHLPELHRQVRDALSTHKTTEVVPAEDPEAVGGADGLRSLPRWLFEGSDPVFQVTYIEDWQERGTPDEKHTAQSLAGESEADNWDVDFKNDSKPWSELTCGERIYKVAFVFFLISVVLGSLYLFICSLSFLADGFRLVAGKNAGELFRNSEVFNNPVAGMLVGLLVTVLVQSSSTSTSIVITMVAAELLTVRQAIYLVMGANIGTSVTSTIVAMGQVGNRDEFRRAFAAATVHDMFNFCSVLLLLPLEAATGYLYELSGWLISLSPSLTSSEKPPDILKVLTNPFTKAILGIDTKVITKIAAAKTDAELAKAQNTRMLKAFFNLGPDDISDGASGTIVLIASLTLLCVTLFVIVLCLKALLKGRVAVWLHKFVNGNIPDIRCSSFTIPLGWVAGYLAILAGFGITICVQSSSITTSAITPLVGVGVVKIERMFPIVIGANIGTCITGVLAALAADGSKLALTLQVAYCHLFFNLTATLVFYCIWPLRRLPIGAAKFLGDTTAEYRWFAGTYLVFAFFLVPLVFVGLSFAGAAAVIIVVVICALIGLFVVVLNVLQSRKPEVLPQALRTWEFLPKPLRSLEPYDRLCCTPMMAKCCRSKKKNQVAVE